MFANQNKKKVEESSESEDEPMPSLPPEKRKGKGRAAAPLINKSAKGKVLVIEHCEYSTGSHRIRRLWLKSQQLPRNEASRRK